MTQPLFDVNKIPHHIEDKATRRAKAIHLRQFGYAPGDYMMRCKHCTNIEYDSDKYSVRCRDCAHAAYIEHLEQMSDFNFLKTIEDVCKIVGNTKADQRNILASATEELGELAVEVKIAHELKKGPGGKDGIVGEAIDLILCGADMIHSELGSLDNDQVKQIVMNKLAKWQAHYTKPKP